MPTDQATIQAIQNHFHALIRERSRGLADEHGLALPEIVSLFSTRDPKQRAWLPVPGMYGGFTYWAAGSGPAARLMVESWSRVVEGSGQRHEVTPSGYRLIDEGFV